MTRLMIPFALALGILELIGFALGDQILLSALAGCLLSGVLVSSVMVSAGSAISNQGHSHSALFASSLRDNGAPAISVLNKFVCVIFIINPNRKNLYLFVLIILYTTSTVVWAFLNHQRQIHTSPTVVADLPKMAAPERSAVQKELLPVLSGSPHSDEV